MAGILKVDTIQNANADNIITQTNSTTLTIGTSGDTVTLAAGATSSGFGATYNGAVNWDTTAKTTTVTAVSGNGYFINTTSGAVTVNLPAGSAGSIVALSDYAGTWDTNAVTVNPNGTDKIGGTNAPVTLNTKGQAVTFVYVDSTRGWINTGDATYIAGNAFVAATGGTITTCGDFKVHTFTGPGTFTVTNAGAPSGSNSVDYLVVAGGGGTGGGGCQTGGGGAGGFRMSNSYSLPAPTTSPLASSTGITVAATAYPITVGSGGAPNPGPAPAVPGNQGNPSIFSTITSAGGGAGQFAVSPTSNGGSGGGIQGPGGTAGSGNTPPVSPPQGNSGGTVPTRCAPQYGSSGGGGAGAVGNNGTPTVAGNGGVGSFVSPSFAGSNGTTGPVPGVRYFAGGGGGGGETTLGTGGAGGGGSGSSNPGSQMTSGTANTGGGGGSGNDSAPQGTGGGSGIIIIRYKFQ
jgi:hypothetical protein